MTVQSENVHCKVDREPNKQTKKSKKCLFLSNSTFLQNQKHRVYIYVKIINNDKVLCILPQPTAVLEKNQTNTKQNNGCYNGDNNMHLIYFTALICISPKTRNPSLTPAPPPNTILKYLSAHSKHISCALFSLWTSWRRWRSSHWEGGGTWKRTHYRWLCVFTGDSFPIKASWHGLNDCIVKMIFGLLTDGFYDTHMLPLGLKAQHRRIEPFIYTPSPRTWQASIHIESLLAVVSTALQG